MTTEQEWKWQAVKARMDALDDGYGPWKLGQTEPDPLWPEFKDLCYGSLGQGYSLACLEGSIIDNTTAYAFRFFKLGREPKKGEDA